MPYHSNKSFNFPQGVSTRFYNLFIKEHENVPTNYDIESPCTRRHFL